MVDRPAGKAGRRKAGEPAPMPDPGAAKMLHPSGQATPKRKGRPRGTTKEAMAARAKDPSGKLSGVVHARRTQEDVLQRHRQDCERLAKAIKAQTPHTTDPKDIGALARATSTLHELERAAYGMDQQAGKAVGVILIPVESPSMESWNTMAGKALQPRRPGRDQVRPAPAEVLEDDIQGEPPEGGPGDDWD